MRALQTDLYQLTMAAGYFEARKVREKATFELFVRRMPPGRDYLIFAGLPQVVEYLQELRFKSEEIDYLKKLPQFGNASSAFFDYLAKYRFTGDLFAMPEGTPFLPNEPTLIIRAPMIEAQIPETYVLSTIAFQTMIASKAHRVVTAAGDKGVVEFGSRRAHSPQAGVLAARAAYIGGCSGTSNVEAGYLYGVPVFGTCAHSWVTSFGGETTAFRQLQRLLGSQTVQLIDTYDTIEGARRAASLGRPLWGVRLDSGDLLSLSREVRTVLDAAGLNDARIMASGDVNEQRIAELVAANAPIDSYGVGTELATSADAPNLAAVYKMIEIDIEGIKRYTAKFSPGKITMPGAKQVFRYKDRDVVGSAWECVTDAQPLLRPVMLEGRLIQPLPSATDARERRAWSIATISKDWPMEYSDELLQLSRRHQEGLEA